MRREKWGHISVNSATIRGRISSENEAAPATLEASTGASALYRRTVEVDAISLVAGCGEWTRTLTDGS